MIRLLLSAATRRASKTDAHTFSRISSKGYASSLLVCYKSGSVLSLAADASWLYSQTGVFFVFFYFSSARAAYEVLFFFSSSSSAHQGRTPVSSDCSEYGASVWYCISLLLEPCSSCLRHANGELEGISTTHSRQEENQTMTRS